MADYSKREKSLLTMTIYMANIFQSKDINKLIDSVTMDRMQQPPVHIPGAPGCLNFAADNKNLAFCAKDKTIADQLVQAYFDFQNCRKGKKPLSYKDVLKLLMECEKNVNSIKPKNNAVNGNLTAVGGQQGITSLLGSTNSTNLTETNSALNAVNNPVTMTVGPYYKDLKVPGTI
jgi:hypothetical protein